MRIEIVNGQRVEFADDNMWLYKDIEGERRFAMRVYLGKEAQPWTECTTAEKEEFERTHPIPEPQETI